MSWLTWYTKGQGVYLRGPACSRVYRVGDLGYLEGRENQMDRNLEHEMETG